MDFRPVKRRIHRVLAITMAMVIGCLGLAVSPAAAESPRGFHPLNLVVLGDSFAAGVGNVPYRDESGRCKRSDDAYGPLLAKTRLVTVQAFVACSGATTEQVWGPYLDLPPQIDSITHDTDVVTVQALGNDFFVGAIEALCFLPSPTFDCTLQTQFPPGTPLSGQTVGGIIASIPLLAPAKLDTLYQAIKAKLGDVHSKAIVVATDYPNIVGRGGPFCPGVTAEEAAFTMTMVTALDTAIKDRARRNGVRYAPVAASFRNLNSCVLPSAIYPPLPAEFGFPASQDLSGQGALHPNRLGQLLYAAAVGKRLFF